MSLPLPVSASCDGLLNLVGELESAAASGIDLEDDERGGILVQAQFLLRVRRQVGGRDEDRSHLVAGASGPKAAGDDLLQALPDLRPQLGWVIYQVARAPPHLPAPDRLPHPRLRVRQERGERLWRAVTGAPGEGQRHT